MKISIAEACELLNCGSIVAVPTETVYGLAASLTQPAAVDKIFALKGRPSNNPLIVHTANLEQIIQYVTTIPEGTQKLAEAFWPGPLTLTLPSNPDKVPSRVRAGLTTTAFRIPNHPLTRELLQHTGPLVMPSANISGRPSATQRAHVEEDFGIDFPVLDGGACSHGVESTILHHNGECWQVIRLGALSAETFAPILGYVPAIAVTPKDHAPLCPGQLYRHYAPNAQLILSTDELDKYQGVVIGFSDRSYPEAIRVIALGPVSTPEFVAESLYAALRQLDQEGVQKAIVDMRFPKEGLWLTIAERLKKAAAM